MIARLEQYATLLFDQPMAEKILSYSPIVSEFTSDHPIEAAVVLICFVIIIITGLSRLLFRGSSDQTGNSALKPSSQAKPQKGLARKLERLAHLQLRLYEVTITDDMSDLISEGANQHASAPDADGLSPTARAMLKQFWQDGKIT